jgi:hypothetical protein
MLLMQDKHHRWLLDGPQIRQYGLENTLDPEIRWWENSIVDPRQLLFFSVGSWLTFCTLICEDLARVDPVSKLIRGIGPNLVFALLMDGPQLQTRWSGKYATVLADDPGSSVLTVSSLGMIKLSQPPEGVLRTRVVALWKDARNGTPRQIELPEDHHGVLLSLGCEWTEEYSADGRGDRNSAAYLTLLETHAI